MQGSRRVQYAATSHAQYVRKYYGRGKYHKGMRNIHAFLRGSPVAHGRRTKENLLKNRSPPVSKQPASQIRKMHASHASVF